MIVSKNHSGFTLVETLAALAIFALVATPLFLLESSLTERVSESSRRMKMILEAKKFLYDARRDWQKRGQEPQKSEKVIPGKNLKLQYIPQKIAAQSMLKDIYGLYSERVLMEWTTAKGKQSDILVAYLMVPPQEKAS